MYKNSETGMESMIEPRLSFSQMLVSNGLVSQIVIDYVRQKYGNDCVANIITYGTLGAKMVIRDVSRVHNLPYADADRLAKSERKQVDRRGIRSGCPAHRCRQPRIVPQRTDHHRGEIPGRRYGPAHF